MAHLGLRQLVALAQQAGFRGRAAEQAAAIAIAESSGDPHNRYAPGPQEDSRGLMQINVVSGANPQYRNARLYDPLTNMKIAYHMSGGGRNWGPWTTYGGSTYQHALAHAAGLAGKVGPYAQSPRLGPSPAGGTQARTIRGFKNSVTPGNVVKVDETGAAIDTLMSHKHGHLLQDYVDRLNSGGYTTVTPTAQFTRTPVQARVPGRPKLPPARGGTGMNPTALKGTTLFEGTRVAAWIAPVLHYARQHGWKGSVTSGFRSYADQVRIYNSGVRPAARPGTSNHEGANFPRGAVDVSNAAQLSAILHRSPYRGRLVWAGSKDPVHFSHPHGGSY